MEKLIIERRDFTTGCILVPTLFRKGFMEDEELKKFDKILGISKAFTMEEKGWTKLFDGTWVANGTPTQEYIDWCSEI